MVEIIKTICNVCSKKVKQEEYEYFVIYNELRRVIKYEGEFVYSQYYRDGKWNGGEEGTVYYKKKMKFQTDIENLTQGNILFNKKGDKYTYEGRISFEVQVILKNNTPKLVTINTIIKNYRIITIEELIKQLNK